jgi:hypothetical protein
MNGGGETALSMVIKAEAIRQIKIRVSDPKKQSTTLTVASIGYLSSGVCVCLITLSLLILLIQFQAYGSTNAAHEVQAHEDAMVLIFSREMK